MNSPLNKNFIILASALICNQQGQVLLLQRSQNNKSFRGLWQLPEGKINFGEQPLKALIRELKEELHCQLKKHQLFLVQSTILHSQQQRFHLLRIVFLIKTSGLTKLSSEHVARQWFALNRLPTKLFPGLKAVLQTLKKS
ncbi:MAG: NUDIX domain-containing protein [Candidatus Komeilibacteria bacterium]|nr:NUDIX domain-containing protein [Candidatus Komeilibacteria bacterium]